MKADLMDLICCPDCRSDLTLEVRTKSPDGEILEGTLACTGCGHRFPIEDGIPNLLPAEIEGA